jgi:hypothetical protein
VECLASRRDKKITWDQTIRLRRSCGVTLSLSTLSRAKDGADDGIRTRDLRFTKPLLYQLSYVGKLL